MPTPPRTRSACEVNPMASMTKVLLDLSDNVFGRTARRLAGLTDEELLWEPAPHCWSVRERTDV